jgi:hypothetical protein
MFPCKGRIGLSTLRVLRSILNDPYQKSKFPWRGESSLWDVKRAPRRVSHCGPATGKQEVILLQRMLVLYKPLDGDDWRNQFRSLEFVKWQKSRWLRTQHVNRVLPLTLTEEARNAESRTEPTPARSQPEAL